LNRLNDPNMGTAPAEIVVHSRNDLIAGRFRVRYQETVGLENHAGRAESALKGIVLDKGLLDRVKLAVFGEPLNGFDVSSRDVPHGQLTGGNRLVVQKDRTGAAQTLSATKFRSGKGQIVSQNPQERSIRVDFDTDGFVVEGKLDGLDHFKPPTVEKVSPVASVWLNRNGGCILQSLRCGSSILSESLL
jgi:hypothetical protein